MQNKKYIAITGGIGAGKSAVSQIIRGLGYLVLSADDVYADLLHDEVFVSQIHALVGVETDKKTLDREKVSKAVFSSPEKLALLNDFTHAKIMDETFRLSKGEIVFHEVPLLFESGYYTRYDHVLIISRSESERVKAVQQRSGLSKEEVEKRIKNQFSYENLPNIKHTVITNDGNLSDLESKIKAVLNEIL